ncbi:MAG: hypothetical protein KW806_01890 [Candidatus Yanofskybacteria bacterium]|nr:hypothetical protein [Candidatus Yanofskybacteria bacterium]
MFFGPPSLLLRGIDAIGYGQITADDDLIDVQDLLALSAAFLHDPPLKVVMKSFEHLFFLQNE